MEALRRDPVAAGARILEYHLATPWTPTDNQLAWFRNELTAGADFPVIWDGEAFFNALAADFPATADRFFKGPDMLEAMVNAKAVLASSPVEAADEIGFQEALGRREEALRELRDLVSDHYYIDVGTRTSSSATEPPIDHDSPAVMHRYLHLGGGRWSIESIVPKTAQATAIDPINLNVRFLVEPGSDDEQTLEDWRLWGVPFEGLSAMTRQSGGPLGEGEESEGLLSFRSPPVEPGLPGLTLEHQRPG